MKIGPGAVCFISNWSCSYPIPSYNIYMHSGWFQGSMLCAYISHWGRVKHICVGKLTVNGLDNGLSLGRRQAIIRTNAGILLIIPLGTNFSEVLIGFREFSFKEIHLKMAYAKWRSFCLGLNVLIYCKLGPGTCCIMGYFSGPRITLSHAKTYSPNWVIESFRDFCVAHGSYTRVLCAIFQSDSTTAQ